MARTWKALRDLAIQACGGTPRAENEMWSHLSEAHRLLASQLDVPELASIDTDVLITSGTDNVAVSTIDFSVFAILDCFNKTDRIPMFPEPFGMSGRRMYLEETGLPPAGSVTHYCRDGSKLYVRETPTEDTTIMVRVQRQMPDLSSADATSAPITPQQYDRALVHKAAELYYLLHPNENVITDGQRTTQQSDKHSGAYDRLIQTPESVRAKENMARVGRFRLTGFRITPRSRRGR